MAKDRPSLQDEIRRRQQGSFVGRQGQVVQFEDNLRLPVGDEQRRFLFNIHGDAGVGKTYLTKRLLRVAMGNGNIAAYVDEAAGDPTSTMMTIAESFKRQDSPMGEFEKRANIYKKRRLELEADPSAPSGVAAFLTKTAVTIGLAAARDVPVAGALLAPIDAAQVAEEANLARTYLVKKFGDRGEAQLLISPQDELTPLFVSDLNRVSIGRPVTFFFDAYERIGSFLDDWLRNLYAGQYGDLPATLITTISGQMPLDFNLWADYLPVIGDLPLEPFSESEARLFLSSKNINEENIVRVILTLSGRLPLWLATLADARPRNAADVGDPAGDVVERFLRWEEEPVRRGVALAAAFPRILNQDVLAVAAPDGKPLFGWLCGLPFVSRRGRYWEYHEVVRGAMLRLQLAEAPGKWRSSHLGLAKTYERWAEDAAEKSGTTWTNENWIDCTREAMYHFLCADPVKSLSAVLESAIKAAEHSKIRLRQWAELIIDASRDTGDTTLSQYGQRLQDLIRGSENELAQYFMEPDIDGVDGYQPSGAVQLQTGTSVREVTKGRPTESEILRKDMPTLSEATLGSQQNQISILGPPGSGKTTFLASLNIALARQNLGWTLTAMDEASADSLIRLTELLVSENEFPLPTAGIEPYNFALSRRVTRTQRAIFRSRKYEELVEVRLKIQDIAGESMHYRVMESRAGRNLLDTVAESKGIVFLLDPIREYVQGDTFDFVFGVLTQLMQRFSFDTSSFSGRLPHYVAVCINKFDDPRVYATAKKLRLVTRDPVDPRGFPQVSNEAARELFIELGRTSGTGNGEMLIEMIDEYFERDRTRYFVTSAVGLHLNRESGMFDESDPENIVLEAPSKLRIRGAVHPINVAESITWLSTMLLDHSSNH